MYFRFSGEYRGEADFWKNDLTNAGILWDFFPLRLRIVFL